MSIGFKQTSYVKLNNMKNLIIIFIISLLTLSSCKRWQHQYPEDTEKTKLTPEERLTGKIWTLSSTTFNGMDYTDSVKNVIGKYEIYFSLQEDHEIKVGYIKTEVDGVFDIFWLFGYGDGGIGIVRQTGIPIYYPFVPCYDTQSGNHGNYTILKLSEAEFKIQFQNNNKDTTIINKFTK